jgi:hypothetical protein
VAKLSTYFIFQTTHQISMALLVEFCLCLPTIILTVYKTELGLYQFSDTRLVVRRGTRYAEIQTPYYPLHFESFSEYIWRNLSNMSFNSEHCIISKPGWPSGIALGYGLDDREFRVLAGAEYFSLHHRVRSQPPTHWVPGGCFPGGKADGSWSWTLISI